jgi:hypothetical protein
MRFQTIPSMHTQNASIQTTAAHGQRDGNIDHPDQLLMALEMSGPNSNGSEKPDPLAFSTGDPESEAPVTGVPGDDVDGVLLVVDAGLNPTEELQRPNISFTYTRKNGLLSQCGYIIFTLMMMMRRHSSLSLQRR